MYNNVLSLISKIKKFKQILFYSIFSSVQTVEFSGVSQDFCAGVNMDADSNRVVCFVTEFDCALNTENCTAKVTDSDVSKYSGWELCAEGKVRSISHFYITIMVSGIIPSV